MLSESKIRDIYTRLRLEYGEAFASNDPDRQVKMIIASEKVKLIEEIKYMPIQECNKYYFENINKKYYNIG